MTLSPYQKDVLNAKICPYCKSETKMLSELQVYGKIYKNRIIIACNNYPNCDAYVGTHDNGMPLGRLANKHLRHAKNQAHEFFDKIWRENYVKRKELYGMLSNHLELPEEYTHIGMFNSTTCKQVRQWSMDLYNQFKHNQHENTSKQS